MKYLLTSILFLCALVTKSQDTKEPFWGKMQEPESGMYIVGDSSVTDSIGKKYFAFRRREVRRNGEYSLKIYEANPNCFQQYIFYNGYLAVQKYYCHGKLLDHIRYKEIIKHFKLKY